VQDGRLAEGRLAVEYRPAAGLIPYARNSRTHSDAQVAQIAASIREFGWTNPILVDGENGIIAGHGRLLAARKLELAEVPVIELSGLTEAQKRAYIIADNKTALNAGWDEELLALEFGDLESLGFDLSLTGFGEEEIASIVSRGTTGLTDPDEVPEPPQVPVSRTGDLWLLGKHRLICGDATNAEDVERVLSGVRPHLLVSDPPFGVNYDPSWREHFGNNEIARGKVLNDDRADWREARHLPGARRGRRIGAAVRRYRRHAAAHRRDRPARRPRRARGASARPRRMAHHRQSRLAEEHHADPVAVALAVTCEGRWYNFARRLTLGDPVVATAILNRLLHHCSVITIRGDSYPLSDKRRAGRLQKPARRMNSKLKTSTNQRVSSSCRQGVSVPKVA
jgi:hypothetical protein